MKTLRIHSLNVCISCFGEVTKFFLSQLVLLFNTLVLAPYTFLSSLFFVWKCFLCFEVFFDGFWVGFFFLVWFCLLVFDRIVILSGYLDIFA